MDALTIVLYAVAGVAVVLTAACAALFWPSKNRSPFEIDSRRPRQPVEHSDEARRAVLKVGFTIDRVPKDLDVAIVGSGVGGLLAGALLTKAGKRVCVFEQHDQAGGCLHTFFEDGYEFDTGIHYIGEMLSKSAFRVLIDQATEGQVAWAPLDAVYDTVALGRGADSKRVGIAAGRAQFAAGLRSAFPREGRAIDTFMQWLADARADMAGFAMLKFLPRWLATPLAASGAVPTLFRFFRKAPTTLAAALRDLTDNAELRAVLAYSFGDYGTAPSDVPLGIHLALLNHFLQGGAYPVGGSSEIAFHLCRVIQAGGGAVLVRAPVRRIELNAASSAVTGVLIDKGDGGAFVAAPVVVSDAGIFNTFQELLPLEPGRPLSGAAGAAAAGYLKHVRHGLGGFQVFVGLEGSAQELGIGAHNMWAFSSPHLEDDLRAYTALEPSPAVLAAHDVPLIFISFPSAKDPTWAARFPHKSTCEIVTVAPWKWFSADEGKRVGKRGAEYEARKGAIARRAWAQVQALFPGLAGRAPTHLSAGSPVTNAHYYRAQQGVMYGVDHNVSRFTPDAAAALRPGSALGGLFLTGQDVFMCGFAGASFGGLLCASEVLGRNLYVDLVKLKARIPPPDFGYGIVGGAAAAAAR